MWRIIITTWLLSPEQSTSLNTNLFQNSMYFTSFKRSWYIGKLFELTFAFNSSALSSAYVRQWIRSELIQIMACRLFVPSHYLNQCCDVVNWTRDNKLQWNFNQNKKLFIHENAYKISSAKWRPFCRGGDELNICNLCNLDVNQTECHMPQMIGCLGDAFL